MSISKKHLRTFLNLLNENGIYQLQKENESIYRKVIEYFTTKSKSKTDLNIQRIDNLKKKGNSYFADCLYGNKIKKMKLELGDKRLLSLLKDYEYKIKGNLKVINEIYSKLKEQGLTEEDYKEIKGKEMKEMIKYIQNKEKVDNKIVKEGNKVESMVKSKIESMVEDIQDQYLEDQIMVKDIQDQIMVKDTQDQNMVKDQSGFVNKESLTTSQPPSPKKINFTNLLIYSRFK